MNPDYGQLAMGWGMLTARESYADKKARTDRRKQLHRAGVARRRKAKRGGKR